MNCITFFAGAGGLDMGIHQAGFDIRLSVEIQEKYCNTLRNNHPDWNVVQGDIMDYTRERVLDEAGIGEDEEIDLIAGGSPCQSFSTTGRRGAFNDPRGMAMLKYADLVRELQPRVFLLENVKGLLSAALQHRPLNQRGEDFAPLSEDEMPGSALRYLLEHFGNYRVTVNLANSADYGVAQKRERVFIIGVRDDIEGEFRFPSPTHSKDNSELLPWRTFSNIIEELEDRVNEHTYVNYSEARLRYMKMIPRGGGNWRDLPEDVVREAMGGAYNSGGGKVGFFRRIKMNEPAPTLLTSPHQKSTNIGHPLEDRPLSIEEYLAIQGFPINYNVVGTLNDKYTQIGNAVPVLLAFNIANEIAAFLRDR